MNTASVGFYGPLRPLCDGPGSVQHLGDSSQSVNLTSRLGRSFPQAPTLHHPASLGGQVPARIPPLSLSPPGRASPRWAACLSTGARQSPVWGMNEPEGLSTPLWWGRFIVHTGMNQWPCGAVSGGGLGAHNKSVKSSPGWTFLKTGLWCFKGSPEGGHRGFPLGNP